MKSFELGLPFKEAGEKHEVISGNEMKGSFTNLSTNESFDFYTGFVYRDTQQGTFRLHGAMTEPGNSEKGVGIRFVLASKDSPSGQYFWGNSELKSLFFMEYPNTYYLAEAGSLKLERNASEVRVNGRMEFTAAGSGGVKYKVDVIFNKKGMN